jgi:hypothetical protein
MIFKLILDMQDLIGMRIDPRDLVSLFKSQKKTLTSYLNIVRYKFQFLAKYLGE